MQVWVERKKEERREEEEEGGRRRRRGRGRRKQEREADGYRAPPTPTEPESTGFWAGPGETQEVQWSPVRFLSGPSPAS